MEKLCWVDLEMTGLNVESEVIIECAMMVTDLDFQVLDSYHAIVRQDQKYLDAMDEWNKNHHTQSGLAGLVPSGKLPQVVEDDLITICKKHFSKEKPVLAGNSISQDRSFIKKYWPRFSALLHYRMLDVSSWKILMKSKFNVSYEKKSTHRAVDDIQESINELKHYLQFIKT